ncbi:hypothetical protein [Motilimonas eburnea]|nr:hypothetical protein [Motilimonas eburnea]
MKPITTLSLAVLFGASLVACSEQTTPAESKRPMIPRADVANV